MRTLARRRLTLLDAVLLIGVTAGAVAWARAFVIRLGGPPRLSDPDLWGYGVGMAAATLPFGLLWSVCLAALRLLGPRHDRRRLARQPGLVACVAVVTVAAAAVLAFALGVSLGGIGVLDRVVEGLLPLGVSELAGGPRWLSAVSSSTRWAEVPYGLLVLAAPELGLGVAIAWLTQLANGRWRAERDWIDRGGRLLGLYWIGAGLIFAVVWLGHLAA